MSKATLNPMPPRGFTSQNELLSTERGLIAAAIALGARKVGGWTQAESTSLAAYESRVRPSLLRDLKEQIRQGADPLGDAFCKLRTPAERRPKGAVFTPPGIVTSMGAWAEDEGKADRVVDPGIGSGRFLLDAARRHRGAALVGFDIDPVAAIIARANLAAIGAAGRSTVLLRDYCRARLPHIRGKTLFIGNPPYIRHHELSTKSKEWLTINAARHGHTASQLAGMHVHFFLATLMKGQQDDYGAFITAAEWLDVNYGSIVREMLLADLGGKSITVIEPTAEPFLGIAATGAITTFQIRSRANGLRLRRVDSLHRLGKLAGGKIVRRERLECEHRWSHLTRPAQQAPADYIELGELCRVHRGQVTGANRVWIAEAETHDLPDSVLFRTVTKAQEVIKAGAELVDDSGLRIVIDLPVDLDEFESEDRYYIDLFLKRARKAGAHKGYIARYRKAWWSVGLRAPAAILATYMARRTPAFALNVAGARHINIAHGFYPREAMDPPTLKRLVEYLCAFTRRSDGRTYAGGLTKFEPREMERLMIPPPDLLEQVVGNRSATMV